MGTFLLILIQLDIKFLCFKLLTVALKYLVREKLNYKFI